MKILVCAALVKVAATMWLVDKSWARKQAVRDVERCNASGVVTTNCCALRAAGQRQDKADWPIDTKDYYFPDFSMAGY